MGQIEGGSRLSPRRWRNVKSPRASFMSLTYFWPTAWPYYAFARGELTSWSRISIAHWFALTMGDILFL